MRILIPATAAVALFAATGAIAQTTSPTAPATPPSKMETTPTTPMAPTTRPATPVQVAPTMTEAEAKELIDANVVSSDKKNVGEVAAIQRDSSGKVIELHADVGGFLGMGETRVRLMPSQFTVANKQVNLTLTSDQISALPKIEKK
jgi:multidrug efflux pump subunit AcrA (membrane-fusion protein)